MACRIAAIGIEPSGGYERAVIRALLAADLSVRRINPNMLAFNLVALLPELGQMSRKQIDALVGLAR